VVAKIEKPEAMLEIDEIIRESDALMVARGDLGVEVPMEQVPADPKGHHPPMPRCNTGP
jgi:pyruvate kinase